MMNRFVNSELNEEMLVEIASNPEKFIVRSISKLLIAELEAELEQYFVCAWNNFSNFVQILHSIYCDMKVSLLEN